MPEGGIIMQKEWMKLEYKNGEGKGCQGIKKMATNKTGQENMAVLDCMARTDATR